MECHSIYSSISMWTLAVLTVAGGMMIWYNIGKSGLIATSTKNCDSIV